MTKKKKSFRSGLFFLLGVCVYSVLFWLSEKNHAHVFGSILIALAGYLIYLHIPSRSPSVFVKPQDVIYACIGVIFDSFSGGFPFAILPL